MRKRVRSGIAISHCGDEKQISRFSLRERDRKRGSNCFSAKGESVRFAPFPRKPKLHGHLPLWEGHKARYVRQQGEALAHTWAQATREEELRRFLRCSTCIQKRSLFFTRRQRPRGTKKRIIALCGAFSGRATSTAAVGVVHDSFISYSDGHRHRWSHNPFCVNRHDIFQNSTAEQ